MRRGPSPPDEVTAKAGTAGVLAFYALFVAPLLVWLGLEGTSRVALKRRFPLAIVVLASFFILLVVGTPELYSYYFLGRA